MKRHWIPTGRRRAHGWPSGLGIAHPVGGAQGSLPVPALSHAVVGLGTGKQASPLAFEVALA